MFAKLTLICELNVHWGTCFSIRFLTMRLNVMSTCNAIRFREIRRSISLCRCLRIFFLIKLNRLFTSYKKNCVRTWNFNQFSTKERLRRDRNKTKFHTCLILIIFWTSAMLARRKIWFKLRDGIQLISLQQHRCWLFATTCISLSRTNLSSRSDIYSATKVELLKGENLND